MFKGNISKIVLCATANKLLAGIWHAGKLQGCQSFVNHEDGYAAFAEFMQSHQSVPVYLMVDAVEEDYRLESLPHTTGTAKRELINRKLNQFYRGLDYRTAHFISRDKDKRKDDNYLFAALNNDEFMKGWVAVLQQLDAQLVGVYLLPMLSRLLAKQLKLTGSNILLCERLSSGLRQSYFHNGYLSMSRLVPNVPDDASKLAYFYLVETEKTRLYLMSKRFISLDTRMQLVLASADGETQSISQAISQEQGIDCLNINLTEMVKNLDLPLAQLRQQPELLHMQLLADGILVDNLAPEKLTKSYRFKRLSQAIKLASLLIGITGVSTAAWLLLQGLSYQSDYEQAVQDTLLQEYRYREAARNFPDTAIDASNLQIAVELDNKIAAYPKSPRRMMQVLSAALAPPAQGTLNKDTFNKDMLVQALDNVQLNRLRWMFSEDMNVKDDDKLMSVPQSTATPSQVNSSVTISAQPGALYEIGFVTAEIIGFNGDYRAAINTVNRYVANLQSEPRVAVVEVLQEPVNVSSFVDLKGSTADEQSMLKQAAHFKLKVILKSQNQQRSDSGEVNRP